MNIVLITGGSRGIGAATALACAQRGLGVIVTYHRNPEAAAEIVHKIGRTAVALKLDVTDTSTFPAFATTVRRTLQETWNRTTFDYLVNNAGHGLYNPIATVTEDQFDDLYRVHLKGPFFLTQTLLPQLADGGHIVNLTSTTTRVATPGVAPYATFKGGLEVLTRYMAKEFADRHIRANSVSPGAIRTDLGGGLTEDFETHLAARTALARVGEPDEVASVIAALLSDDHRWVNAQSLEISGGFDI